MRTVVAYSGGLDSTVLLYHLRDAGHELKALSVDYGQRHRREVTAGAEIAGGLGVEHRIVDLSSLASLFPVALTSPAAEVPRQAYSPETLPATTVPNRNMVLLSIAI